MKLLSFLAVAFFTFPSSQTSQQSPTAPQRDPQAVSALQNAVAAMGGTVPSDSVTSGTIATVAGSQTTTGTILILTRSTDQTSEAITANDTTQSLVFARGLAAQQDGATLQSLQLELAVTSQCADFPLPLLAGFLNNADTSLSYVALEALNGHAYHHIRTRNTFNSNPSLKPLSDLTVEDIWLDSSSGLPWKFAYNIQAARGAAPKILAEIYFSDYRNIGGVLYPFQIAKSLNGTPYATITISSVSFNTGLADSSFQVQ